MKRPFAILIIFFLISSTKTFAVNNNENHKKIQQMTAEMLEEFVTCAGFNRFIIIKEENEHGKIGDSSKYKVYERETTLSAYELASELNILKTVVEQRIDRIKNLVLRDYPNSEKYKNYKGEVVDCDYLVENVEDYFAKKIKKFGIEVAN